MESEAEADKELAEEEEMRIYGKPGTFWWKWFKAAHAGEPLENLPKVQVRLSPMACKGWPGPMGCDNKKPGFGR